MNSADSTPPIAVSLGPPIPHAGPEVLKPASRHEKSWYLDEFAGGGYVALPNRGTTVTLCPCRRYLSFDIRGAGSETVSDHPGYLDGAIEAGERAATEVIDALADQ